jgi:hypothetical protein
VTKILVKKTHNSKFSKIRSDRKKLRKKLKLFSRVEIREQLKGSKSSFCSFSVLIFGTYFNDFKHTFTKKENVFSEKGVW